MKNPKGEENFKQREKRKESRQPKEGIDIVNDPSFCYSLKQFFFDSYITKTQGEILHSLNLNLFLCHFQFFTTKTPINIKSPLSFFSLSLSLFFIFYILS